MNVNKKLGRFKQWAGEKMGGEVKTGVSDEFKALEAEMDLRHSGLERMQRAMTVYVKSLSKRAEGDDREKTLPGGYLGSAMVTHSEDFEPDSEFGTCLASLGRANERLSRVQETYVGDATSAWLEGLDRSLAQMKEYQAARKKLEQRRLAYDTTLAKMQKAKKEDFLLEEELRTQKAKYEESNQDVFRRMQDIKEAEMDLVQDLTDFLEAELSYYDRCREILLNVKRDWPVKDSRRIARSRSITAHGYAQRFNPPEEEPAPEPPRVTIPRLPSRNRSPPQETSSPVSRPPYSRTSTYDSPGRLQREASPAPRLSRVPTEPTAVLSGRAGLRPVRQPTNTFSDDYTDESVASNGYRRDRSPPSPATSHGSERSRATSYETPASATTKKAPPPPPPSRAKKPPPPPPPMKRSALSASETSHY
ncbi:BAR-domain-containing protein [Westerdykella ornata]|uniref:BAR-domain-containing protein n=1 Tax=Westerdykella ornata TaxID=318751 RepID=A0A6A6JF58_WESOR|nr:BAR-domain-containing protein [Westerdykella ornata]KAF2275191.1 BAR-domain-containing protein [Westerdykella ornata]